MGDTTQPTNEPTDVDLFDTFEKNLFAKYPHLAKPAIAEKRSRKNQVSSTAQPTSTETEEDDLDTVLRRLFVLERKENDDREFGAWKDAFIKRHRGESDKPDDKPDNKTPGPSQKADDKRSTRRGDNPPKRRSFGFF